MNDTTRDREAPSAYPWLIAFVGMFALFLSNGMTATGITIFDPSLLDEFGWSRADFKLRDLLNFVMVALFSPIFGILIDRWNPKYLLMTGCGLLTLGYFGYSMIANGAPVPLIEAIAVLTFVSFVLSGVLLFVFSRPLTGDNDMLIAVATIVPSVAAAYLLLSDESEVISISLGGPRCFLVFSVLLLMVSALFVSIRPSCTDGLAFVHRTALGYNLILQASFLAYFGGAVLSPSIRVRVPSRRLSMFLERGSFLSILIALEVLVAIFRQHLFA